MKLSLTIVASTLAIALAGCGDGPREDYGKQVSAAALELNRALIDLGTTVSQNADAAAIGERLRRQIAVTERTLARLRRIEPPDGAGSAHAKLVAGVQDYLRTMRRAAEISTGGDLEELIAALRSITDGNGPGARQIREASEELDAEGFRVSR